MLLHLDGLRKTYAVEGKTVPAVRGVSFSINEGEVYTLLGPSGCGKSTTLRCVAGLEHPDDGEIHIAGQVVFSSRSGVSVPAYRRDIGMVFQSYAIWPHMNVFDNVAFPLVHGNKKYSKQQVRDLVDKALSLVRLDGLAGRSASLLSGGQQQRVALARALVYQPAILLLDEPLSNLDARLRDDVRKEIKSLVKSLHLTVLYVTHDQVEALSLSDRIAVMRDGVIVQESSPQDIYLSPRSGFVGRFIGNANLIDGTLTDNTEAGGACSVNTELGQLRATALRNLSKGDNVVIVARPDALVLHTDRPSLDANVIEAQVESLTFTGSKMECRVRCGETRLEVIVAGLTKLEDNQKVYLQLPPDQCQVVLHRD